MNELAIIKDTLKSVAHKMILAAKTAPKGRGQDNIAITLVEGAVIEKISEKMKDMAQIHGQSSFARDAENILKASMLILIGTKIQPLGLKTCGLCGFKNCEEKSQHEKIPCVFNTGDLGIAIGSAVSIAADNRVDNRIMYTVGLAVLDLGLFPKDIKIVYAIPLSATAKNPFFDRK